MSTNPGERLRIARIARGYRTSKAFAAKHGIPQPTYSLHETGNRGMSVDVAKRYADLLDVSAEWLLFGRGEGPSGVIAQPAQPAPAEEPAPAYDQPMARAIPLPSMQEAKLRDLPVLGSAMAGPEGYFEMQGQVIEHVWRPPFLMGVRGAFALYVVGQSMSPRYEEGELVYCTTNRRPAPGQYVVVEMKQESDGAPIMATIGRYRRQTASHVELEKLNPAGGVKLPAAKVHRIHVIVGTGQP